MTTKAKRHSTSDETPKYKGPIRGLYINQEMHRRFEQLRGRTIYLNRLDPEGNPYLEAYEVPEKIITMVRDALFEFFDILEMSAEINDPSIVQDS